MYKTIWAIKDNVDNVKTELTYYHLGHIPKFPTWYMEENHVYEIEMLWNFKLIHTPILFFKCLTGFYIIK